MGNYSKSCGDFIRSIPDSKLDCLPDSPGTIFEDKCFHLDMQGMTSDGRFNLQIQAKRGGFVTKVPSRSNGTMSTVCGPVLLSKNDLRTPQEIRQLLVGSYQWEGSKPKI